MKHVIPQDHISGLAANGYELYGEDIELMKSLGFNAYRFSVEWSRIEPREDYFDADVIRHYREVVKTVKDEGMEPFVTLWHWTIPVWFRNKGGFEKKRNISYVGEKKY